MDARNVLRAVAEAVHAGLVSPNERDRNLEPANVVDGLFAIARALHDVADAVRGEQSVHARGRGDAGGE